MANVVGTETNSTNKKRWSGYEKGFAENLSTDPSMAQVNAVKQAELDKAAMAAKAKLNEQRQQTIIKSGTPTMSAPLSTDPVIKPIAQQQKEALNDQRQTDIATGNPPKVEANLSTDPKIAPPLTAAQDYAQQLAEQKALIAQGNNAMAPNLSTDPPVKNVGGTAVDPGIPVVGGTPPATNVSTNKDGGTNKIVGDTTRPIETKPPVIAPPAPKVETKPVTNPKTGEPIKPTVEEVKAEEQVAKETAQTETVNALLDYMQQPNEYLDKLNSMTFQYNPLEDPAYLRDAAGLENQVAQMMVGRGGLYSSVANAALQSRLMDLQVNMIKQKRSEFVEDRNFTMAMAQNEMANRNNYFNQVMAIRQEAAQNASTAFNQNMATAELAAQKAQQTWDNNYKQAVFKADQADRATQLEMQKEQLRQAEINAQRDYQIAQAKADIAQQTAQVQDKYADYVYRKQEWEKARDTWASTGIATSYVVAAYAKLGIKLNVGSRYSQNRGADITASNKLNAIEQDIRSAAFSTGQATDIYGQLYNLTNPTVNQTYTTEVINNPDGTVTTKYTTKGTNTVPVGTTTTPTKTTGKQGSK